MSSRSLFALLLVGLTLSTSGDARAEILGPVEADRHRIAAHLERVERALRAVDDQASSPAARAQRRLNLHRLRAYRLRGQFPRNRELAVPRIPTFIDHEGRACAVGALMIASGHEDLARTIAARENHARVWDIETPGLVEWVDESGLTVEECALIQPSYCDETLCSSFDTPVCGESGESYACLEVLEQCTADVFVAEGECPYEGPDETTATTGGEPLPLTPATEGCAASGRPPSDWPWIGLVAVAALRRRRERRKAVEWADVECRALLDVADDCVPPLRGR